MGGCYSKGRARGGTSVGYQVRFNPNDDKVELLKGEQAETVPVDHPSLLLPRLPL